MNTDDRTRDEIRNDRGPRPRKLVKLEKEDLTPEDFQKLEARAVRNLRRAPIKAKRL